MQRIFPSSCPKKGAFAFDAGIALLLALSFLLIGVRIITDQHARVADSISQERREILALEAADHLLRSAIVSSASFQTGPFSFSQASYTHAIDDSLFNQATAYELKADLGLSELRACMLSENGLSELACMGDPPSAGQYCIRRIASHDGGVVLLETCVA